MNAFRLEFEGAAGQVTGSRTCLTWHGRRHLVDCGLFQGSPEERAKNWESLPQGFLENLENVFLTHAHLDHSGYLPRLRRSGYLGPIWTTLGTRDLAEILLRDAAHLQEEDADYANRTGHSRHKPALPLFTRKDVDEVMGSFKTCDRDSWVSLGSDFGVRFLRSGHLIGSSFVQLSLGCGQSSCLLTFSGDVGRMHPLILKEPVSLMETDILVLESTYGGRRHSARDPLEDLAVVAKRTLERGGILLIPSFAVGRAQEVIYLLKTLETQGRIPSVPVVLDSPMSIAATDLFLKHDEDHGIRVNSPREFFPRLFEKSLTPDESLIACMRGGPAIVISASGMLAGGRILHHLKKRLPDKRNTVLFVGHQATGSKGHYLLHEGAQRGTMRIHHEEIPVEAEITSIDSLSAHSDEEELLQWLKHFQRPPQYVFLNHGEPESAQALAARIRSDLGWTEVHPLLKPSAFQFDEKMTRIS